MFRRYYGILEKEPKSLWGVWFPDLPGCTSAGSSEDEAVRNASEAVHLYAEELLRSGEPMPEPRGIAALMRDADVKAAEASRVAVISVPFVRRDRKPARRINVTMNASVLAAIDDAATRLNMNRSAFLESAALEKVAETA